MKALIFGGAGQLGSAMMKCLPEGATAIPVTRADCDLSVPGQAEAIIAEAMPAVVFNCAAYTAVDRAEQDQRLAEDVNALAPGRMAAAAHRAGAAFVHLSTDFVFDGRSSVPYRPEDSVAPLGVYGRTKLAGERAVLAAHASALIVRTAWVYAAQGANFMLTMLRLMRERGRVSVVSDQIGTPTYAASLAESLWALSAQRKNGIFHVTDSGVASWYDFAVAIAEEGVAAGLLEGEIEVMPIATADYPTPAERPSFSVLDKRATWAALGSATPHWRTNLRRAIKELSNNG